MIRRGTSILETLAVIAFILPVAAMALGVAGNLQRRPPTGDGRAADLACLQLRRDAVRGATIAAGDLLVGSTRWHLADGWLCRDETQRLRVDGVNWTRTGTIVTVRLAPHLLPERTLELEVQP